MTSYEYSYDLGGRLASVTKNGVVDSSYEYDSNGNRISGTQNGIAFTSTFTDQDQLESFTEGSGPASNYEYNANGELVKTTQGTAVTLVNRDLLGRLKSVRLPNMWTISYKLDGMGRKVDRAMNGGFKIRVIWEDALRAAGQITSTGQLKEYVHATSVNSPDYIRFENQLYRMVKDHLGSVRLVVNAETGVVTQRLDYNEWGKVTLDTNPRFQLFGFAGGLYDPDTKLVQFGARDYDGRTGRWLSKDPILFNGGDANLYGYVLNDPVNFVDPWGLYSWDEFKKDVYEFADDVSKAVDKMEKIGDELEAIRKAAYCKINPKGCGDDPAEKPIPEEDEINPKNICPIRG